MKNKCNLVGLLALVPMMALATLHVGDLAPDFTLPDTAYVNHNLSEWRGRVVLLTFWQSTCGHCRAELPRLEVLYQDYKANGFIPVTANLQENIETVKAYARQYTYPFLCDNGGVWGVYRQNGYIPLNYIVDPEGVIRYIAEGFNEDAVRQVILQYLPGPIEHDVGVTGIIAPSGSVDSGTTVVPACSVYNFAENVETYPVRMRIGTLYDTVAMVSGHQPGTARYIEFPAWTAQERGQLAVRCSTELAADDIVSNDAKEGMVTVNVYDLAVTMILVPRDSVDSAATVVPSAVVENKGTIADMAKVKFTIGDFYSDSVNVPLQAGVVDTAYFNQWTALQLGTFAVRCTVGGIRGEHVPENNLLTGTVRVVRGSGIEEQFSYPNRFALYEVYPNPATGRTEFCYSLPHDAQIELQMFSLDGKLVRTLRSGRESAGRHSVVWDGRNEAGQAVGKGSYYYRLKAGEFRAVRKLVKTE
ncbi:hypothetical protein CH330_03330 [candidate division WOR-3 bacterium JGI_Cruoil_03_51_56]|uniref:Thioredoxin domain-containing protein n=1 Tax=candidate division WOR-3 bacterium JGI_Cruoil_03_51_56 TaxID=1973747 RepID=A0A235BWU1_UNCW3|nr:MAG: hypothetical protein CH330_07905 [candidate division WOR-3 bacterium JGI_Cruoil_03_51_56]OYD16257.1 MAG: hypothetical protein CH330_03330 [candidate division WOR-3 bacterium JGI_Cruoil_03_51_56]